MSAEQGAPIILRYEQDEERQAFVAAFADAFELLTCDSDEEAISYLTNRPGPAPALVVFTAEPDRIPGSLLIRAASGAGCFRVLITGQVALDDLIHLLDDQVIDRCYTQPWDANRLRADLFTASMAVDPQHRPKPLNNPQSQPLVLIVDDETAATKYLSKHLLRLQDRFGIRCAASADDALRILQQEGDRIAALMTDQRMPGMKGVQLITELRQAYPHITRILTSAYGELEVALGAVNEGRIYRYEKKPWDAQELLPVLEDAIAQHDRLRAANEARHAQASTAFDLSRRERRDHLLRALASPSPQALGSAAVIDQFLSDLEGVTTLGPGPAQRRSVENSELDRALIRGLRGEVSCFMAPEQGSQMLQGHVVPSAVAEALDVLLTASGLSRASLRLGEDDGQLWIASDPGQPLQMYRHLLSPLSAVSNPLIQQQGALLALYLWADQLEGELRLSGGQHSFSLSVSFPATAIAAAREPRGQRG